MTALPGYYREVSVPHRELSSPQCCGESNANEWFLIGSCPLHERVSHRVFPDDITSCSDPRPRCPSNIRPLHHCTIVPLYHILHVYTCSAGQQDRSIAMRHIRWIDLPRNKGLDLMTLDSKKFDVTSHRGEKPDALFGFSGVVCCIGNALGRCMMLLNDVVRAYGVVWEAA